MAAFTVSGWKGLVIRKVGSGPLAGEEAFGEGGDEDHRHIVAGEDVLHRVDAAGVVGQLDVGEHEAGDVLGHGSGGFVAGGGHAADGVAEFLDQGFDVGGDHRLVLDDQDFGRQFGVDLGLGFGDQGLDLVGSRCRGSGPLRWG